MYIFFHLSHLVSLPSTNPSGTGKMKPEVAVEAEALAFWRRQKFGSLRKKKKVAANPAMIIEKNPGPPCQI